jgi:hypothetical protein
MMSAPLEQRNGYKGITPCAWVRVRLIALDGTEIEIELLADTGNPYPIIISTSLMKRVIHRREASKRTNFGLLAGGWLLIRIHDINFDQQMIGFANDAVVTSAQTSCSDFQGLLGLLVLRLMEFGGDPYWFWIRPALGVP